MALTTYIYTSPQHAGGSPSLDANSGSNISQLQNFVCTKLPSVAHYLKESNQNYSATEFELLFTIFYDLFTLLFFIV